MTNINLNLYKYFYEVAKSKSYTDASNKMYISKTAISKNIKELEKQLGTQLFYRESTGVRLTIDGEKLFETIDKTLTEIDATEKLTNIEKFVFPVIAKEFKISNFKTVKWSVQKLIDSMVRYTKNEIILENFPYIQKPTTKMFLSMMNQYLKKIHK